MNKITKVEIIKADLPPGKKVINDPISKEDIIFPIFNYSQGEEITRIQHFECGHVNNLKLKGRVEGICPKGCE